MIGNFGVSELRTITAEHFGALALPVGEFLALEHGTEYWGYAANAAAGGGGGGSQADEAAAAAGVSGSAAHRFVSNRHARRRPTTSGGGAAAGQEAAAGGGGGGEAEAMPPRCAGDEVGQPLVLVSPGSLFSEVVGLLTRHRLHRVYVVDEGERPVGVVTCTDVLRRLMAAVA